MNSRYHNSNKTRFIKLLVLLNGVVVLPAVCPTFYLFFSTTYTGVLLI